MAPSTAGVYVKRVSCSRVRVWVDPIYLSIYLSPSFSICLSILYIAPLDRGGVCEARVLSRDCVRQSRKDYGLGFPVEGVYDPSTKVQVASGPLTAGVYVKKHVSCSGGDRRD